jgi:hypothetical protein
VEERREGGKKGGREEGGKRERDQYQWLIPIVLAAQEVEIRRITVQSQPRQIVQETLS